MNGPMIQGTRAAAARVGVTLAVAAAAIHAATARATGASGRPPGPPPPVAPMTNDPLPDDRALVSMVFPIVGTVHWHDNYDQQRDGFRHTGVDLCAPKMSAVLAPISGVLGFKIYSFWIVGEGKWAGWRVLGTHLNDDTPGTDDGNCDFDFMFAPNLRRGDRVVAGQLIGYVGNSTDATAPHLHLELHGPEGIRDPTPSLNRARHLTAPVSAAAHPEDRPGPGEIRLDGCLRDFDPARRAITLQMVARQAAGGPLVVTHRPTRSRAVLTEDEVQSLGGPEALAALPGDRVLRVYVTKTHNTVLAVRIVADEGLAEAAAGGTTGAR